MMSELPAFPGTPGMGTGFDQLDAEDLAGMGIDEIAAALQAGRLRTVSQEPNFRRPRDTSQADTTAEADARVQAVSSAINSVAEFDRFKSDPAGFIKSVMAEGPPGPRQLNRSDLQSMSPEAIMQARQDGQLDSLLGIERKRA
jgi:hypothetical protein